ncbi:hypothetical protein IC007_0580 [Sulfuracidifex tepidarius]|uniref:Uncharacterized protein n=2 Tax=Sulfuracidifex tepidarius TaxID=1294262 RepID=A0A510E0R0_9CREN|nr:hypothetical protein IC007_0580 [Sulfuracidifex tepidarius]
MISVTYISRGTMVTLKDYDEEYASPFIGRVMKVVVGRRRVRLVDGLSELEVRKVDPREVLTAFLAMKGVPISVRDHSFHPDLIRKVAEFRRKGKIGERAEILDDGTVRVDIREDQNHSPGESNFLTSRANPEEERELVSFRNCDDIYDIPVKGTLDCKELKVDLAQLERFKEILSSYIVGDTLIVSNRFKLKCFITDTEIKKEEIAELASMNLSTHVKVYMESVKDPLGLLLALEKYDFSKYVNVEVKAKGDYFRVYGRHRKVKVMRGKISSLKSK